MTDVTIMTTIGAQLARIHASGPPAGLPELTNLETVQRSHACAEDLLAIHDELGSRAVDNIGRLGLLPPMNTPVLLHGDLHTRQFLVDGHSVALIDWDRAGSGDTARDLGTLSARLHLDHGSLGAFGFAAVLSGYSAHSELPPSEAIAWHRSHAMLRSINVPYRRVAPAWIPETESILAEINRGVPC